VDKAGLEEDVVAGGRTGIFDPPFLSITIVSMLTSSLSPPPSSGKNKSGRILMYFPSG
jgi:hypothetical protein